MEGVPKLPRVNPGTILNNPALDSVMSDEQRARALALPPEELWSLEEKYDVDILDCYGPDTFQLRAELEGIMMLNWTRDAGPLRINRVRFEERHDLLDAFRKSLGLFFDPGEAGAPDFSRERYIEVIGDTPVLELCGGVDFDEAAAACRRFIEDGEMAAER